MEKLSRDELLKTLDDWKDFMLTRGWDFRDEHVYTQIKEALRPKQVSHHPECQVMKDGKAWCHPDCTQPKQVSREWVETCVSDIEFSVNVHGGWTDQQRFRAGRMILTKLKELGIKSAGR